MECGKYGTLHDFACHPCAGAMLIFSVSFQFQYMYRRSEYGFRTSLTHYHTIQMACLVHSLICTSHIKLSSTDPVSIHTHQYALFQHKYNTQYTKSTHNSASQTTLNHSLLFSSIVIHNYIFKQPNAHTLKQTNKQTNTHTHRYIDSIELENNPKQFIVSYASS